MPGNKTTVNISNISFSYPGLEHYIIRNFTAAIADGWTAVSGNNGSGKSTLLKLISGELNPETGTIRKSGSFYYCRQDFYICRADLEDFYFSYINRDSDAGKLAALLRIDSRWFYNTDDSSFFCAENLSEGEKKRLQLACALFKNPDILAVDEPFNHVDENGRLFIMEALSRFRGTGLIVTHDRGIADKLCSSTIVISGTAVHRKGSVSGVIDQLDSENMSRKKEFIKIREDITRLKKEHVRRKGKADCADRKKSKKGISEKDHDAKAKVDIARLTGKDGQAGKLSRQIESRIRKKEEELSQINYSGSRKSGISITDSQYSGDAVIRLQEGKIKMGEKELIFPELLIRPGEKIALTGNNGTGKTTLIRNLIKNTGNREILFIPQEFDDAKKTEILLSLEEMPAGSKGEVFSNFARLGSDPEKLIESSSPSPGEWKKLCLSIGILDNPCIIILDEPVNHMDLSSIKSLETALIGISCAMLITSHDITFREAVTEKEWKIHEKKAGNILEIIS